VLGEPGLRADLVRRGRERVSVFSWERSVARIREVYQEVVARA
jgi:glycosyltransferase involved in cell wall biosynthesis